MFIGLSETGCYCIVGLSEFDHGGISDHVGISNHSVFISLSEFDCGWFIGLIGTADSIYTKFGLSEFDHSCIFGHGIFISLSENVAICIIGLSKLYHGIFDHSFSSLCEDDWFISVNVKIMIIGLSETVRFIGLRKTRKDFIIGLSETEIVHFIVELGLSELVRFIVELSLSEIIHYRFVSACCCVIVITMSSSSIAGSCCSIGTCNLFFTAFIVRSVKIDTGSHGCQAEEYID